VPPECLRFPAAAFQASIKATLFRHSAKFQTGNHKFRQQIVVRFPCGSLEGINGANGQILNDFAKFTRAADAKGLVGRQIPANSGSTTPSAPGTAFALAAFTGSQSLQAAPHDKVTAP
jgi:hypothetical protein